MTEQEAIQAQIILRADFLRAKPEYRKPRPGIIINTIADAIKMYAWSPDWYHWFKFSSAVMRLDAVRNRMPRNGLTGITAQRECAIEYCRCADPGVRHD